MINKDLMDPIALSQELMRLKSVTPDEGGTLTLLEKYLKPLGYICTRKRFEGVENLYARLGTEAPNLCFAGHVDVVPPGDTKGWKHDPFSATIEDGNLFGRGASDMKAAIAAWVVAATQFGKPKKGSLSLLITCDEEGPGTYGTKAMLEWMKEAGETIDGCIIGEPTNPDALGQMVKIGRRGSVSFTLEVTGVQGHAAYPEKADNPITHLIPLLHTLKSHQLDKGTKFFPPSNLEITSVDVGNPAGNVIPAKASAMFNIRFNDQHTGALMVKWVEGECGQFLKNDTWKLHSHVSAEPFFCPPQKLAPIVADAVKEVTKKTPEFSTTGGTSDGRHIHHVCKELVECGLINETAHKVNEHVSLADITALTAIYERILKRYFA